MNKPQLRLQTNLFWEDIENPGATKIVAEKYFDICLVSDRHVNDTTSFSIIGALRGSIDLARKAGLVFRHANALSWLPRFREDCVNSEGIFLDLKEIGKYLSLDDGSVFVRPVSPFKEIAGEVFSHDRIKTEIAFLEQNKNIRADELICVMAPAKHLSYEWRCVFVNNKLISSSLYMKDGALCVGGEAPTQVIDFANKLGRDDYFLNIFDYVLDVALVGKDIRLVEVNAFETASFYGCDLDKIYSALAGQEN